MFNLEEFYYKNIYAKKIERKRNRIIAKQTKSYNSLANAFRRLIVKEYIERGETKKIFSENTFRARVHRQGYIEIAGRKFYNFDEADFKAILKSKIENSLKDIIVKEIRTIWDKDYFSVEFWVE